MKNSVFSKKQKNNERTKKEKQYLKEFDKKYSSKSDEDTYFEKMEKKRRGWN